jgi:TolB protein
LYAEGGDVWTVDPKSGAEEHLLSGAFSPSWSPDGNHIAVDAGWGGAHRIWVTDKNGHNPRQVTSDSSNEVSPHEPRWSPDGKRLVFRRLQQPKSDIVVVDLATGKTTWVTHDDVVDVNPAWSPSGRFIYFSSLRGGGLNLWRVAVSGSGEPRSPPEQLTTGAGDDLEPRSPPMGNAWPSRSSASRPTSGGCRSTRSRENDWAARAGHRHDSGGEPGCLVSGWTHHRVQFGS